MAIKQQEKSRQTKLELMDSAMALFGLKGYRETTVAEITRHAGYSKGNFYRHWASKDDLFLEIIEHKLKEYRSTRDVKLREALSLEEALRIIWDFLEDIVADRNWAKVFLEFTIQGARNKDLRKKLQQSQYRLSEKIFARLVRPFVDKDFPAETIGALNTALFEGFLVHNVLETGVIHLKDIREAAVTLAMAAANKTGAQRS